MSAYDQFSDFRLSLVGLELTHVWQGHGSALFLEFGTLSRVRRNGALSNNPFGELSVDLEFDWRIEMSRSIVCGSGGNRELWNACFSNMLGASITDLSLTGLVPELCLELSSGHRVLTCSLDEDGPNWNLIDRRGAQDVWLSWENGALTIGDGSAPA